MPSMDSYSKAAVERAMKVQEVILRALAKKITWWQAAEIIGISDRQMRRWHERYEEFGYDGLFDRRRGRPSPKRVPLAEVERVLGRHSGQRHSVLLAGIRWHRPTRWTGEGARGSGRVCEGRRRGQETAGLGGRS